MYPAEMEKWEAKGKDFQDRLSKNYPRWVRGYTTSFGPSVSLEPQFITSVPFDWSVGAATQTRFVLDSLVPVIRAGIAVHLLPGLHFPFTTDPEAFSKHVAERAKQFT